MISATYEKAVKSAESLLERDGRAGVERLRVVQEPVDEAGGETMERKDEQITHLRHTLHDVVRVLGTFIRQHPSGSHDALQPETQEVWQIIDDYTRDGAESNSVQHIRVPEAAYTASQSARHESQATIQKFRAMLHEQNRVIQGQSVQLDQHVLKYEKYVKLVKEREQEVLSLLQQNADLNRRIDDDETALRQAEARMKAIKARYDRQLQERDAEIASLRRQLITAPAEVFARRADVQNAITHTQGMRSPAEPELPDKPYFSKARMLFSRDKPNKIDIPPSRSMATLVLSPRGFDMPQEAGRTRSTTVASSIRPAAQRAMPSEQSWPVCTAVTTRPRPASDSFPGLQLRSESLTAVECPRTTMSIVSGYDTQKELPKRPGSAADHVSHLAPANSGQGDIDLLQHGVSSHTSPVRRILSGIPEMLRGEAGSERAVRTASSEQEVSQKGPERSGS